MMKAQFMTVAAILAIAGTSQAQLINPSFENPGFPQVFQAWDIFGGNIGPDTSELILDGAVSVKMFGGFTGGFSVSGMFQTSTATVNPGDIWSASINAGHITGDALQPGARAFVSLVYRDGNGINLFDEAADALLPGDPLDTFILSTASAVAPLGAEEVQIVIGFIQDAPTSDVNGDTVINVADQAAGAGHFDLANVSFVSAGNPIPFRNGGFENSIFGREFEAWTSFGNSIGNIGQNFEVVRFDGVASCFMYGQFNGVPNDSGVYQGVPASAGESWEASVNVRPNPGDEIGVGNSAILSLQFLNAAGAVLSDHPVLAADSTTSSAAFIPVSTSATAPAGTAEARIVLVYTQAGPDGLGNQPAGAVIFDGADLALAVAGYNCCDVNADGLCTAADFSSWIGAFNTQAARCDTNNDGLCTAADFSSWIAAFNASNGGNPIICN